MLKELYLGSTDFTVGIFKIPQISKHFSAILLTPGNDRGGASDSISQSNQIWFPLFWVHRT